MQGEAFVTFITSNDVIKPQEILLFSTDQQVSLRFLSRVLVCRIPRYSLSTHIVHEDTIHLFQHHRQKAQKKFLENTDYCGRSYEESSLGVVEDVHIKIKYLQHCRCDVLEALVSKVENNRMLCLGLIVRHPLRFHIRMFCNKVSLAEPKSIFEGLLNRTTGFKYRVIDDK